MSDPPILRLSQKRPVYPGALPRPRKRAQDYSCFSEYYETEILAREPELPSTANVDYADLKRRRRP